MSHEEEDTCNKDVCKTFAEDSLSSCQSVL